MKRKIFFIFLSVLFVLLQIFAVKYLSYRAMFPNFLLLGCVYFGMQSGVLGGAVAGFVLGFCLDVLSLSLFGSGMFMLTLIGGSAGIVKGKLDESQTLVQLLIVFVFALLYTLGVWFWQAVLGQSAGRSLSAAALGQALLTLIVCPFIFLFCAWLQYLFKVE